MPAKLAYAQWVWGTQSKEQFITSCKELSSLGYKYFESVRAFIDTFKDDREAFKAITEEYDLRPISFYFHFSGNEKQDIEDLRSRIDFIHYLGIKTICIQGCGRQNWSGEVLKSTLRVINEYGRICRDYGILPSVHPHANTSIMYEKETDFIMQNTDPALIGFAPDTAHLLVSDCDPAAVCRRYKDRVSFTHIKDVKKPGKESRPVKNSGWQDGIEVICNFLELGEGDVNFDEVFDILKGVNYSGYLCVELDRAPQSNIESARKNLAYMKKHWGADI